MSEWIEWKGGECPLPHDTMIKVEYRCGAGRDWMAMPAGFWTGKSPDRQSDNWHHDGSSDDIIAYRIVEQCHD